MEKSELVTIVETIADVYSNFRFNGLDVDERKRMLRSWFTVLGDYDYEKVDRKLTAYFKTGNRFAPSATELIPEKEVADERSGPYVPSYEETMRYLDERDAANQAAANMTEEERAHVRDIQRQIERNLGIVRHQDASNA